nr:unnamed protein product [Spirometra erinaceieuropaei]
MHTLPANISRRDWPRRLLQTQRNNNPPTPPAASANALITSPAPTPTATTPTTGDQTPDAPPLSVTPAAFSATSITFPTPANDENTPGSSSTTCLTNNVDLIPTCPGRSLMNPSHRDRRTSAFATVVGDPSNSRTLNEIPSQWMQARFLRGVSELEHLGFIKGTRRRIDHVSRLRSAYFLN